MQEGSRQIWNPHGDEATLVDYVELVAMDKDITNENGALGLNFQETYKMLAKDKSG